MSLNDIEKQELFEKIGNSKDASEKYIYWYAISKHCLDQETRRIARKEFKTLTTFACGLVDFDIQNEYICCKENNEFLKENWKNPELIYVNFLSWLDTQL